MSHCVGTFSRRRRVLGLLHDLASGGTRRLARTTSVRFIMDALLLLDTHDNLSPAVKQARHGVRTVLMDCLSKRHGVSPEAMALAMNYASVAEAIADQATRQDELGLLPCCRYGFRNSIDMLRKDMTSGRVSAGHLYATLLADSCDDAFTRFVWRTFISGSYGQNEMMGVIVSCHDSFKPLAARRLKRPTRVERELVRIFVG